MISYEGLGFLSRCFIVTLASKGEVRGIVSSISVRVKMRMNKETI